MPGPRVAREFFGQCANSVLRGSLSSVSRIFRYVPAQIVDMPLVFLRLANAGTHQVNKFVECRNVVRIFDQDRAQLVLPAPVLGWLCQGSTPQTHSTRGRAAA